VNLSYLVVMKDGQFYGIFSERDYSRNVILKGLHSDTCLVKEIMNTSLPFINLEDSVEKSMQLLNTHKTRYLLVFDENVFIGVITINDVLREAIANKQLVFDEVALRNATELQDQVF
ncbi:MAG: CBS domain-containing protein, partial [Sphingobacteriales bacterium]|nr:CBS domain-containing protein [Sphingobacteriales bacterium]